MTALAHLWSLSQLQMSAVTARQIHSKHERSPQGELQGLNSLLRCDAKPNATPGGACKSMTRSFTIFPLVSQSTKRILEPAPCRTQLCNCRAVRSAHWTCPASFVVYNIPKPRRGRHLGFDVVQHLPLCLHQHSHVQEDLVQVQQAAFELLDSLVPLLDLCQRVQNLLEQERGRGSNDKQ